MLPHPAYPRALGPRRASGWVGLLVILASCNGEERGRPASGASRRGAASIDVRRLGQDLETTLSALRLSHLGIVRALGAHRVSVRSSLKTEVPSLPPRTVEQDVDLRVDAQGSFAATKNTHPQHGQEVIWTGGWLYPRLRYSPFLRRQARPGEPEAIANRMYGLLPAYVDLLGRFLRVEAAGTAREAGREAVKVRLSLAPSPRTSPGSEAAAKRWRHSVAVKSLEGQALLCARTGAPLRVELRASWTFHPPAGAMPASGIPSALDGRSVGTMTLSFRQEIRDVGQIAAIQPPDRKETRANLRRVRLEYERQILTGERPLPREEERAGE